MMTSLKTLRYYRCVFHCKVKSIIDACHIFASHFHGYSKFLVISSMKSINKCQGPVVYISYMQKKYILEVLADTIK